MKNEHLISLLELVGEEFKARELFLLQADVSDMIHVFNNLVKDFYEPTENEIIWANKRTLTVDNDSGQAFICSGYMYAIKCYRERTKCSLRDAKTAIDKVRESHVRGEAIIATQGGIHG